MACISPNKEKHNLNVTLEPSLFKSQAKVLIVPKTEAPLASSPLKGGGHSLAVAPEIEPNNSSPSVKCTSGADGAFKTPSPPRSPGNKNGHHRSLSTKLRDFFTKSRPPVPIPSSSGSDDGSLRHPHPDTEHFQILSTQVEHIDHPEDVCFKEKYKFFNGNVIGKGASGTVRLCTVLKDRSQKIYAVKEFRKRRRAEPYREYLRKITSEYCIAHMMQHPNIVETVDIMHGDDRWYEVMEYCAGGDVYASIHSGQQSRDEALCFFKQLVRGVHYMHSMGVAHRDLKPDNLLIAQDGTLKIADFGVASVFHLQWESEIRKLRGICGSSPYIAPEEWTGGEYDAEAIDVWGIGIILYAMLYRAVPWEVARDTDPHFKCYLETRKLALMESSILESGLKQILLAMLEPEPTKRMKLADFDSNDFFNQIHVCIDNNNNDITEDSNQLSTHSHDILDPLQALNHLHL